MAALIAVDGDLHEGVFKALKYQVGLFGLNKANHFGSGQSIDCVVDESRVCFCCKGRLESPSAIVASEAHS